MSKSLTKRGYGISKDDSKIDIDDIKESLTVKPHSIYEDNTNGQFKVFLESSKKIYVPKYWGLSKFGVPNEDKIHPPQDIEAQFVGSLRDYQLEPVRKFIECCKDTKKRGGILQLPPGWGKTVMALNIISKLKVKTLIIVHKEFLMTQWKERIQQYLGNVSIGIIKQNVIENNNDIVIASLQSISMKDYGEEVFKGFGLVAIDECFPFNTYINTDQGLIAIGTLYESWSINKDPSKLPKIYSFNQDKKTFELKQLTYAWRKERNELVKVKMSKRVINCTPEHKILTTNGYVEAKNLTTNSLVISKYDVDHQDNIIAPTLNDDQLQIIYGSYLGDGHIQRTVKNRFRLKLTHGNKQYSYCKWKAYMFNIDDIDIIEKNGYSQKPACSFSSKIFDSDIDFPTNTKKVPNELLERLDIRGVAIWFMDDGSYQNKSITLHTNNFQYEEQEKFVKYFKSIDISCDIKKTKNKYHYLYFNRENSDNLLRKIKPYVHESMSYKIDQEIEHEHYKWNNQFLEYGTLRVSSIEYYKNKGYKRCSKPYVYDIEVEDNHNFIIGSKPALSSTKIYIDGPVVSNCHHMGAQVFSRALFKVNFKYSLGLSATVSRKDGLSKVFKWFLGDIVYKAKAKQSDDVNVLIKYFYESEPEYSHIPLLYNGKPNIAKLINQVCSYAPRTQMLVDELEKVLDKESDREVIILSDRRNHLQEIESCLNSKGFKNIGYYVGGMKQSDLKESEKQNILLGTYNMVSEGFDLPKLNTLVLASPKSDVEQSVGRIQRQLKEERKYTPLIIDIVDQFSLFNNQGIKRKTFYKKKGYSIGEIDKLENKVVLPRMAFLE